MKISKWSCAILVALLALAGPLAPLGAMAQMAPPSPPMPAQAPAPREPSTGAKVGAGFLNVVYVPGKVILCSAGTVVSAGFMLATFGSAYRAAVAIFNEGCGGSWALTGYDVSGIRPPEDSSY